MRGSLWDAPCRGGALLRPFSRRNQHQRAEQSPAPTTCPRKKVTSIKILIAPSIDGSCSKATSCKPDTSVSGGAYQDARKVSLVWNDIQNIDACLNSEAERTKRVQALFSPPSFLLREKRWGRRRRVRNDHDGTSRRKRRLLSSVLVSSFPNRKLNLRFGFSCKSAATSQALRASSPGRGALDTENPALCRAERGAWFSRRSQR